MLIPFPPTLLWFLDLVRMCLKLLHQNHLLIQNEKVTKKGRKQKNQVKNKFCCTGVGWWVWQKWNMLHFVRSFFAPSPKETFFHLSETWILPFVVLFAMVAYAFLAIVFYNNDGWFHLVYTYNKHCEMCNV